MPAIDDVIARALGYPYPRPDHSFLFTNGAAEVLPSGTRFDDLVPVLACGSNGAPEQLFRKFGAAAENPIPVTAAVLQDICCTYSAHFSGYGSVAAGLSLAPGARSFVHITWLTPVQLEKMHESEAIGTNYRYARLDGVSIDCAAHGPLDSIYAYISLHGSLVLKGTPITLAGIKSEANPFPAYDQLQIQSALRDGIAPGMDLHEFIRQTIDEAAIRAERTKYLRRNTQKFDHPAVTTILK